MRPIQLFLLFAFLGTNSLKAQEITEQSDVRFIFFVKSIDEFIDRFNNSPDSEVAKYWKKQRQTDIKREENLESITVPTIIANQLDIWGRFSKDVCQQKHKLDFYDSDWFVEITSFFTYKGQRVSIPLVLQSQGSEKSGSKWLIVSVVAPFLYSDCEDIPEAQKQTALSPVSHGINFINLRQAFNDKQNLSNYFEKNEGDNMIAFKKNLLSGDLKFEYAGEIKYHFLQIPDWTFVVQLMGATDITKKQPEGLLISKLFPMSETEKNVYKQQVLNFNQ